MLLPQRARAGAARDDAFPLMCHPPPRSTTGWKPIVIYAQVRVLPSTPNVRVLHYLLGYPLDNDRSITQPRVTICHNQPCVEQKPPSERCCTVDAYCCVLLSYTPYFPQRARDPRAQRSTLSRAEALFRAVPSRSLRLSVAACRDGSG